MSFETFKESRHGAIIAPLLSSPAVIAEMEELSRRGKPAVAALDLALAGKVELSETERQYVGRWVRDVLSPRWRTLHQRRLSGGRLFSSGTVYVRAASGHDDVSSQNIPPSLLSIEDGVTRARALIATFSTNDYGVDDYLRDKRDEARREAETR